MVLNGIVPQLDETLDHSNYQVVLLCFHFKKMRKNMKISHEKAELFEGFYLIKSADLRQTRAGKTT